MAQVEDKKKKEKQNTQTEKYYKNKKADFTYLNQLGYNIYKELGRGGYGVVYKACHFRKGCEDKTQKFAIKMNFMTVTPELVYSEVAFLSLVKGKENLPFLEDLFIERDKIHIVLRYLNHFFADFGMEDIKYYLYELLKGIKALKELGIYHRDIKPGNFLYNPQTRKGCLIDFGLSELDQQHVQKVKQQLNQETDLIKKEELQRTYDFYTNIMKCIKSVGNNKIGTESFMPLESILRYQKQSYSVDIWPVGVIFLQFVLRKYNIFNNVRMMNKPNDLKNNYFITFIMELANIYGANAVSRQCEKYGYRVQFPKDMQKDPLNFIDIVQIPEFDATADDLLKRLLALDQDDRISVENAMDHAFFNSIRQNSNNNNSEAYQKNDVSSPQIQQQQQNNMIIYPQQQEQFQQQFSQASPQQHFLSNQQFPMQTNFTLQQQIQQQQQHMQQQQQQILGPFQQQTQLQL